MFQFESEGMSLLKGGQARGILSYPGGGQPLGSSQAFNWLPKAHPY